MSHAIPNGSVGHLEMSSRVRVLLPHCVLSSKHLLTESLLKHVLKAPPMVFMLNDTHIRSKSRTSSLWDPRKMKA